MVAAREDAGCEEVAGEGEQRIRELDWNEAGENS